MSNTLSCSKNQSKSIHFDAAQVFSANECSCSDSFVPVCQIVRCRDRYLETLI
jgi:hypothetical protein